MSSEEERVARGRELIARARSRSLHGAGGGLFQDTELLHHAPCVHAFLADTVKPDGSAQDGASLFVFVDGGLLKGVLTDRQEQRSLWGSGRTLMELVENLDARLNEDVVDWRVAGAGRRKR